MAYPDPVSREDRLISEFLGYDVVTINYYGEPGATPWQIDNEPWIDRVGIESTGHYIIKMSEDIWFDLEYIHYDKNFNLLMEAVEKFESMDYGFKMCRKVVEFYIDSTKEVIFKVKESSRITSLFTAVVRAIEWYNDNDKLRSILRQQNEIAAENTIK